MKTSEPVVERRAASAPPPPDSKEPEAGRPAPAVPGESAVRPCRVVAIGGGKGGSGKSLVAASLGIELARRGAKVVLVDCDLGGPNLHSLLGMEYPREALSDFVLRRAARLEDVAVPTPVAGLSLIPGARNAIGVANPLYQQKLRLMRSLKRLDADVVLLDLGAGTHSTVVDFFLRAHLGVLVVVPEPTSVENAYRFLKAAFLRRIASLNEPVGIKDVLQDALRSRGHAPLRPAELVAAAVQRDPTLGAALQRSLASFRPLLLINQVREAKDLALGDGMIEAARRLFGLDLVGLGTLAYSDQVWRTVRAHQPVLSDQLGKAFTGEIALIADRLLRVAATVEAQR